MPASDRPEWVQAEYERIGREREATSRETDRLYRWEFVRVCGLMFGWTAVGALIAALAFRSTDQGTGMIYLYSGMVVNVAGVLWTIVRAYRRGEERGDW